MSETELRRLPSVEKLAAMPEMEPIAHPFRVKAARAVVAEYREALKSGKSVDLGRIAADVQTRATELAGSSFRSAINMTGVVLHTGLGRARLVDMDFDAHTNLEIDLESGERGDRQAHVRGLLQELTGAEDALVVNNCAAALTLALRALCAGRDVVLSRGQMVEIGGSFRVPEIVQESGCTLVEVGCTNKTRLGDYKRVLREGTAALLRCHTSNFAIVGFTSHPAPSDLAALAHEHGLLLIDDVGSGCLVDTTDFGLPKERTLGEALRDGADLVTASGDKLLGGPQAGIVLGRSDLVQKLARHPLARAFRIDKLSLQALEQTLRAYASGGGGALPVWRYAGRSLAEVEKLARTLQRAWPGAVVADGLTEMGGGSMPGEGIPTRRVGLPSSSADGLARALRGLERPVFGRIEDGLVWLDPRTAEPDEVKYAAQALKALAEGAE